MCRDRTVHSRRGRGPCGWSLESFVEVVEATTIDFSCVRTGPAEKTAALTIAVNANIGFRNISADIGTSPKGALIFLKRTGVRMSAIGPKRTSLAAPHMSAFGGKADMACCGNPLSRSLLGVKRTWAVALHMSAYDPKRTSCLRRIYSDTAILPTSN